MSQSTTTPSVSLYYQHGSSDKEYHAQMTAVGDLYLVNFQYGRRGSSLTSGSKTSHPVAFNQAEQLFTKLIQEKKAKGYTEGTAGIPYQDSSQSGRVTGLLPQLLNPLDESRLEEFLANNSYAQEKKNGRLLQVKREGDVIIGANKRGLSIALADPIVEAVRTLPCEDLELVGEWIGTTLHCFDLTRCDRDLKLNSYATRYNTLRPLIERVSHHSLQFITAATTPEAKRTLYARLRTENAEGIVFKDPNAPYTPGRPNSGGPQWKLKFTASSTFIVKQHNVKHSVGIQLLDTHGHLISCGNVTIPQNSPLPLINSLIEVEYLYAINLSHNLHQPVYLGPRDDINFSECRLTQLKYQPLTENDDDTET